MVPRVLDQFRIGSTCAFVLNRFAGVSLDLDIKALDRVSDNALRFIVDLHRQTAQAELIDAVSFQTRFGSLLDAAAARNPSLATELRSWEQPLQSLLIGTTMPVVWLHGDFKVENVLYDERNQTLTGVIDWELAMLPGLPLLDPLYLLIYNRLIRGADWVEVLRDMLVKAKYTPSELSRLQSYMDSLGITHDQLPALSAAFIAHHIGCRLHLRNQAAYIEPLRKILEEMCTVLGQAAATRIQRAAV
jgi:aminoglycoside phosphotransferase (APT) family kinase protein